MLRFIIYMHGPTSAAKILRSDFINLISPSISNINQIESVTLIILLVMLCVIFQFPVSHYNRNSRRREACGLGLLILVLKGIMYVLWVVMLFVVSIFFSQSVILFTPKIFFVIIYDLIFLSNQ
jgi:type III secretory pathway component EscU